MPMNVADLIWAFEGVLYILPSLDPAKCGDLGCALVSFSWNVCCGCKLDWGQWVTLKLVKWNLFSFGLWCIYSYQAPGSCNIYYCFCALCTRLLLMVWDKWFDVVFLLISLVHETLVDGFRNVLDCCHRKLKRQVLQSTAATLPAHCHCTWLSYGSSLSMDNEMKGSGTSRYLASYFVSFWYLTPSAEILFDI
jgi:hypothetical protein